MRKSILIKAFGMIAVFGAMVLWSCSQDEEIEEQTEWSKKAVKKSLARSGPTLSENYFYVTDFVFYDVTDQFVVNAAYEVHLTIASDTTFTPTKYTYHADFAFPGPSNPPLMNEEVKVSGMEYNGYHSIEFTISADCIFNHKTFHEEKTFGTVIPPWKF
ncbi:hypothetical protein [Paraprevotella clara]|uniref:hypothetical protein n=1 Tax=Paraprevotella clara TaxID=454154 RepID=UPI002674DAB2|nr:hypothetical protein [Paraprevotella clara]